MVSPHFADRSCVTASALPSSSDYVFVKGPRKLRFLQEHREERKTQEGTVLVNPDFIPQSLTPVRSLACGRRSFRAAPSSSRTVVRWSPKRATSSPS